MEPAAMTNTHPHLEGLIRKVEHLSICLMEPDIHLLGEPAPEMIGRYADQVNEILIALKALAALPGGGMDIAVDTLLTKCYLAMRDATGVIDAEEGPGRLHSNVLTNLAKCRVEIERRNSPTPPPHEAD